MTAPRDHAPPRATRVLYESELTRVERIAVHTTQLPRAVLAWCEQQRHPPTSLIRKTLLQATAEERKRYLREQRVNHSSAGATIVRALPIAGDTTLWFEDHSAAALAERMAAGAELHLRLQWAFQLAAALQSLHDQGYLHRDVNPFNAVVTDQQLWLIDLGLAHALDDKRTRPATGATLPYQAPESSGSAKARIDIAGDLYSLGVSLYELIVGELPLNVDHASAWPRAHLLSAPTDPRRLQPLLSDSLATLLLQLLEKDPRHRPDSAAAVAELLRLTPEGKQLRALAHQPTQAIAPVWRAPSTRLLERDAALAELKQAIDLCRRQAQRATHERHAPIALHLVGEPASGRSALLDECRNQSAPSLLWAEVDSDDSESLPITPTLIAISRQWLQQLPLNNHDYSHWHATLPPAILAYRHALAPWIPELSTLFHSNPTDSQDDFNEALVDALFSSFDSCARILLVRDHGKLSAAERNMVASRFLRPHCVLLWQSDDITDSMPAHGALHWQRIEVRPLSRAGTQKVISRWCGSLDTQTEALADHLYERVGGYPGLLKDAFEQLWDVGVLSRGDRGELRLDPSRTAAISFAGAARLQMLQQRWDRLGRSVQEMLKRAACIGDPFDIPLLRALHEECDRDLGIAARAGIIARRVGADASIADVDAMLAEATGAFSNEQSDELPVLTTVDGHSTFQRDAAHAHAHAHAHALDSTWRFTHDEWLRFALTKIDREGAKRIHRAIAILLSDNPLSDRAERKPLHRDGPRLLRMVQHLNESLSLDDDLDSTERRRIARFNLNAGALAQRIGEVRVAHRAYRFGVAILEATQDRARHLDATAEDLRGSLLRGIAETALLLDDTDAMGSAIARLPQPPSGRLDARRVWLACVLAARRAKDPVVALREQLERPPAPATLRRPNTPLALIDQLPYALAGDRWQLELGLLAMTAGQPFPADVFSAQDQEYEWWSRVAESAQGAAMTLLPRQRASVVAGFGSAITQSSAVAAVWHTYLEEHFADDVQQDGRSEALRKSVQFAIARGELIAATQLALSEVAHRFWWTSALDAQTLEISRLLGQLAPARGLPGHAALLGYEHALMHMRGAQLPRPEPLHVNGLDRLHRQCVDLLQQLLADEPPPPTLDSEVKSASSLVALHNGLAALCALRRAEFERFELLFSSLPTRGPYADVRTLLQGELARLDNDYEQAVKLLTRAAAARLPIPLKAMAYEKLALLPSTHAVADALPQALQVWERWGASARVRTLQREHDSVLRAVRSPLAHSHDALSAILRTLGVVSSTLNLDALSHQAPALAAQLTRGDIAHLSLHSLEVAPIVKSNVPNATIPWPAIQHVSATGSSIGFEQQDLVASLFGSKEQPALLAVAIDDNDQRRSTLTVQRLDGPFAARDEEALKLFAAHLQTALRNARLYGSLSEANDAYQTLFETADQGFLHIHLDGRMLRVNPALASMLGFTDAMELITDRGNLANLLVDAAECIDLLKRAQTAGGSRLSTSALRRDGSKFEIDIHLQLDRNDPNRIIGSVLDVSEREQRQQAEFARRAAEATLAARAEFLAHISHEIRTPLNAIVGFARLGLETDSDAERTDHLRRVDTASQQLLGLLNDVLDLAKIDAGRMELEAQPIDLRQTIRDVSSMFAMQALEKGIALRARTRVRLSAEETAVGDALRLKQILINLVGNAVKFTPHGRIDVDLAGIPIDDRLDLVLTVADTGIGIAPDKLNHVFDAFSQASAGIARRFGGTGLGLAIVKRLVEHMGGTIAIESIVDRGTKFRIEFSLPITKRRPHKRRSPTPRALRGLSALIVDDNALNRSLLESLLANQGLDVVSAEGAEAALDQARTHRFDIVLMDIHMPGVDGITATRRLREFSQVPVLALSADVSRLAGHEQEFSAQLAKPIDPDLLFAAITRATRHTRTRRTNTPPRKRAPSASRELPGMQSLDLHQALHHHRQDKALLLRMFNSFVEHYSEVAEQAKALASTQQWAALETLAHSLKGVSGSFGAGPFQQACSQLEALLKRGAHAGVDEHLATFADRFSELLAAVKQQLGTR